MSSFDQNAESDSASQSEAAGDAGTRSSELLDALQHLVDHHDATDMSSVQRINELAEQLNATQQSIQDLQRSVSPVLDWVRAQNPSDIGETDAEVDKNSWEYRKQSLLNGYTDDEAADPSVNSPQSSSPQDNDSTVKAAAKNSGSMGSSDGSWLDDDVGQCDEAWSPEVMDLRSILEEKLRRAEIEISIERARLHRVNQELEQRRTELELEMARSNAAGAGSNQANGKKKSRLSRFLGRTENDQQD